MDATTKALVSAFGATPPLPVTEVTWARFLFHLIAVSLAMLATGRRLPLRAHAPGLQVLRSLALASCNLLFALALVHVPLADATAINFAGPLVTVALAAVWLKERVGATRWAGVLVGLVGVAVVLRPGMGAVHPAGFFALACAVVFSVYQILTRRLAGVDTPQTTIFQTGLWATIACSLALPFGWVTPDARGWAFLVLLGLLGGVGHFLLVLAFERASASLLAPLAYTGLVWSVLYGLALFGEAPDVPTLAGAAVVAASGLLVIRGERGRPAASAHKG